MAECAIPDCTKAAVKRSWCSAHYARWRIHGDPLHGGSLQGQSAPPDGLCSVETCEEPHDSRGWCKAHYARWRKDGDVHAELPLRVRKTPPDGLCIIDGCSLRVRAQGMCYPHYQRQQRHGDPLHGGPILRQDNPPDKFSYSAVHNRTRRKKGPASSHPCVDCSGPAEEWSYAGGDPDEHSDPKTGCVYSLDADRYVPRCKKCHAAFDDRGARGWRTRRGE